MLILLLKQPLSTTIKPMQKKYQRKISLLNLGQYSNLEKQPENVK